jgi:hypothetical protein
LAATSAFLPRATANSPEIFHHLLPVASSLVVKCPTMAITVQIICRERVGDNIKKALSTVERAFNVIVYWLNQFSSPL